MSNITVALNSGGVLGLWSVRLFDVTILFTVNAAITFRRYRRFRRAGLRESTRSRAKALNKTEAANIFCPATDGLALGVVLSSLCAKRGFDGVPFFCVS
jgi:hypothetical protein